MWISRRLWDERDRRYSEVAAERERALQIKQEADATALELARGIQSYKDEKANALRSQIESERGVYLTREEYDAKHQALANAIARNTAEIAEQRTSGITAHRTTSEIRALGLAVFMAIVALGTLVALALHV
jgi:hypothetical protein